jgi:hypothetical protein
MTTAHQTMTATKQGIIKTKAGHYCVWVKTMDARQLRWTSFGMSRASAQALLAAVQAKDTAAIGGFDVLRAQQFAILAGIRSEEGAWFKAKVAELLTLLSYQTSR